MTREVVARKYAHGLFAAGDSRSELDPLYDEAESLLAYLRQERRLLAFLTAPQIRDQDKEQVVRDTFAKRVSPTFLSFLLLLVEKHRIDHLPIGRIASRVDGDAEPHAVKFLYLCEESVIAEEGDSVIPGHKVGGHDVAGGPGIPVSGELHVFGLDQIRGKAAALSDHFLLLRQRHRFQRSFVAP